jgi:hypothetical protein
LRRYPIRPRLWDPVDFKLYVLRERSVENLYEFLNTEVDLGITFSRLAKHYLVTGDSEHHETSKRDALTALRTVDYFRHRLPPDLRTEIDSARHELDAAISAL